MVIVKMRIPRFCLPCIRIILAYSTISCFKLYEITNINPFFFFLFCLVAHALIRRTINPGFHHTLASGSYTELWSFISMKIR